MESKSNPADSIPKASDYIDTDNIQPITPEQREAFKESDAYKKYVRPAIERDNARKRAKICQWVAKNWLAILGIVVTVISILATLPD